MTFARTTLALLFALSAYGCDAGDARPDAESPAGSVESAAAAAHDPATDAEPSLWSIDDARVVFTATRSGTSDIWLHHLRTGVSERLTHLGGPDSGANQPWPSPDGSLLAYQVRRGTGYDIHVMALDGSSDVDVTDHPEYDVNPRWSPDGTHLAFMSTRGFELGSLGPFPGHLYVVPVTGGEAARVTTEPLTSSFGPSGWAPDGGALLLSREVAGTIDVFQLDLERRRETQLTQEAGGAYGAMYSHDGSRIAYHLERDDGSDILVVDHDGKNRRLLTSGRGYHYGPRWSPDDRWLLITSSADGSRYDLSAIEVVSGRTIDVVATSEDEKEGAWLPAR